MDELERLLIESQYDQPKTQFLVDGFRNGFKLGYNGSKHVKIKSNNLRFRVGNKFDLWNKIMLEVKAKRYAGPYADVNDIPFPGDGTATGWIQSPCGLVSKSNNRTRLINHHSYPPGRSLNDGIDDDHAKVTYQDFQDAIKISLELKRKNPSAQIHYSKLDGKDAFRVLSIHPSDRRWQVLKAENPLTSKISYFVDLCCSFGNRASCFLFEAFSKAIAHIYRFKTGIQGVWYLDDGLQIGLGQDHTNLLLRKCLEIYSQIGMPVSPEKTVMATPVIKFLGLLIDAIRQIIGIPDDKVAKAQNQIEFVSSAKKVTVLDMQKLTGLLNFFGRAIVPGRTFTRQLYSTFSGGNLKQHHHVRVTREIKLDLALCSEFLNQDVQIMRPFVDFDSKETFTICPIFSDAAKAPHLGYATCYMMPEDSIFYYCYGQWEQDFLEQHDPSVQFLELMALVVGVVLFAPLIKNKRVKIHCDNQAVIHMINNGSSSCKYCMMLIRRAVSCAMQYNVRILAIFIKSEDNKYADALSRMQEHDCLVRVPQDYYKLRLPIPPEFMPMKKFFGNF